MIFVSWIILSVVFACIGSSRNIGFVLSLIACLFLSPLIGLIIILCSDKEKQTIITTTTVSYTCKHCELKTSINSHYCPRCFKDSDGYTAEQNVERFNQPKPAQS